MHIIDELCKQRFGPYEHILNEVGMFDCVVHHKKLWVEGIIPMERTILIICHDMDRLCWLGQ